TANGKKIGNLQDFIDAIDDNFAEEHVIETKNGHTIVLPNNSHKAQMAILARYGIEHDCSPDLSHGISEDNPDEEAQAILEHYKGRKVAPPKLEAGDLLGGLFAGLLGGLAEGGLKPNA